MSDIQTVSLLGLQNEGKEKAVIDPSGLILFSEGESSHVITYQNLKLRILENISQGPIIGSASGVKINTIPPGSLVDKIVIIPNVTGEISVGTSSASDELFVENGTSGIPLIVQVDHYFINSGNIYVTATNCLFKIYIR